VPEPVRVRGDLLDQRVDAIVNAWNRNFIPWWLLVPSGVSGAIKRRGGHQPFREVRRHGTLRPGQAVVTSAGRLPYKAIIHVAALDTWWRSSATIVATCVRSALRVAGDQGFASIALPLVGSGTGGVGVDESLAITESEVRASDYGGAVIVVVYPGSPRERRATPARAP